MPTYSEPFRVRLTCLPMASDSCSIGVFYCSLCSIAIPPASLTCWRKLRCSADSFTFFVLSSTAVNIAIFFPTMSAVISMLVHPIRSDEPLHSPYFIVWPFAVVASPTLFRNSRLLLGRSSKYFFIRFASVMGEICAMNKRR